MAFTDYVLIRYLATYTDNASRAAAATNKKIVADANATNRVQLSHYAKTVRGLNQVGAAAAGTGKALSTYVTLPILGVGVAATKMAIDFNTAMTRVHALTGASQKQIAQWSKQIQNIAVETGTGPKALADALYYVASAGLAAKQVMPVVRDSAKAAATGMGDAAVVADVLTSALNAYRGTGLSAAKATDDLVAAIKYGKGEPTDFATSLGRIIGPAAQLRVDFGQTTGAIAALTNQGLDASEAVTGLRQVFVEFLKPSADSQKALKQMGLTANSLRLELGREGLTKTLDDLRVRMGGLGINTAKLGEIVKRSGTAAGLQYIAKHSKSLSDNIARVFPNVRALNAFLLLTGQNAAKTAVTIKQVAGDTGALNQAFRQTVQRSAALQLHRLWATIQVDLIQLGNVALPVLNDIAKRLTGWFSSLQHLSPQTRRLIVEAGLLAAAIGPVLYILGNLAIATAAVAAAFAATPVAVAVAIGAFAAAGVTAKNGLAHPLDLVHQVIGTLQKDWPRIKADAVQTFMTIGRVVNDVGGTILDILRGIKDFFTGDWHDMLKSAQDAISRFGDVGTLVFQGLARAIPTAMDTITHSWQAAATAIGLVTLAILRLRAAGGVGLVANLLGGGGAGSTAALTGESAGAQFAGVYGATRLGRLGGFARGLPGRIAATVRNLRNDYAVQRMGVGAAELRVPISQLNAGAGSRYMAAGRFVSTSAAESALSGAEIAGGATAVGRLGSAAKIAAPLIASVVTSTGGLAAVAVGAAAGAYLLYRAFNSGESATQKLHDALVKLAGTQSDVRRLGAAVGPMSLSLQGQRLQVRDLTSQINGYQRQLGGLTKGSRAYHQVQLQMAEADNARKQDLAQLHTQQQQYNSDLQKLIDKGAALVRQSQTASVGTVENQIASRGPASAALIRRIQAAIAGGSQNAGDLFRRFFSGPLGSRRSQAFGISVDDIKNLVQANQQQSKMLGTIRRMTDAWIQMRQAGIDPASKAMVELRREITKASALHFGLPVAGAQALSRAAGVPVTPNAAQQLQSIGGISSGVIDLARMLRSIPTVKQVRFVSNLPRDLIAPLREYTDLTHKLPSRQVLTLIANAGPASSAIAAFIAHNQKELSGFTGKRVDRMVGNLTHRLADVPKAAMGEVAAFIRRTGDITDAQLKKIERHVADTQRRLSRARQRVQQDIALIAAHPGAAGDTTLQNQLRNAQRDVQRLSSQANSEANKPRNRIRFHITFTGAGVSGAADKTLAANLTNSLRKVSAQVAQNVSAQKIFSPTGDAIPAGVAVRLDSNDAISLMGRHGVAGIKAANTRVMSGIGAQSPSKLWASTVGAAIATGIAQGIHLGQRAINSSLNGVLTTALNYAKGHLKISSPSQVAADQIGLPFAQGIAKGIRQGRGAIGRAVQTVVQHAVAKAQASMGGGPSGSAGAAPPGQVRDWLTQALKITGHFNQANLNALYGRTIQESGGNPRAINLWDSNAKAGHPSKGLLQTIDSTFQSYMLPGHGNIWNPVDNAIAAIRYMYAGYGHIVGPSATGYALGGPVVGPPGQPQVGIVHGGEFVLSRQMLSNLHQQSNARTTHHHIRNATIHVHNVTIPAQAQNWIEKILRAFGLFVSNPQGTVARIRNDIANIMSHTKLSDKQKREIAHFQSEYTAELAKKAKTADQKLAKEARLANIQYSIANIEDSTKLTPVQRRELNRYREELRQTMRGIRITAMLRRFVAALNKHTLEHMESVRKTVEGNIQQLKRGGVTDKEKKELRVLQVRLAAVDGAIVQRLARLNGAVNFALTQANQGLTNLQLRQQLAGTDQTAAGQVAQAQYIRTRILPNLEKQLATLRREETAAQDIHNKALARRIAEAIAAKQGDILQAQLDAQNAIKAATQATADALGGGATISFGYQNQQWTMGQVSLGTGA